MSAPNPGWRRFAATASASSSRTTTMTGGRMSSWRTTACRTSCSAVRDRGASRRSRFVPASRWPATDGSRAGMGTDAGDYDGDGQLDLVVTNLDYEMHSLYRGLGRQLFAYATPESGIGPATLPFVGFGVVFFDFDNDMQLDLAICQRAHHRQPAAESRGSDPRAAKPAVSQHRAAAVRGRHRQRRPRVRARKSRPRPRRRRHRQRRRSRPARHQQRPDGGSPSQRRRPRQRARGPPHRQAEQSRWRRRQTAPDDGDPHTDSRGESGLELSRTERSAPALRAGNDQRADRLEVRWPSGRNDVVPNVSANQIITIREGEGIVRTSPFAR